MVFVQVSKYGTDNTWILDALRRTGTQNSRGVVSILPSQITTATLQAWHDIGVRGVRLNLRSSGQRKPSRTEIQAELRQYAATLRPLRGTWSVGIYADMELLEHVEPLVPELVEHVKLVLEHFGSPAALPLDPVTQSGWKAMVRMMEDPRVYVKLSAPYLFSKAADFKDLEFLATELMSLRNGNGVVFASDWPHTQAPGYDPRPFRDQCIEWCASEEVLRKLFRDNARRLWDVQ